MQHFYEYCLASSLMRLYFATLPFGARETRGEISRRGYVLGDAVTHDFARIRGSVSPDKIRPGNTLEDRTRKGIYV